MAQLLGVNERGRPYLVSARLFDGCACQSEADGGKRRERHAVIQSHGCHFHHINWHVNCDCSYISVLFYFFISFFAVSSLCKSLN